VGGVALGGSTKKKQKHHKRKAPVLKKGGGSQNRNHMPVPGGGLCDLGEKGPVKQVGEERGFVGGAVSTSDRG